MYLRAPLVTTITHDALEDTQVGYMSETPKNNKKLHGSSSLSLKIAGIYISRQQPIPTIATKMSLLILLRMLSL